MSITIRQSRKQTIETRFVPASDTKPSRISAKCGGGRLITSADLDLDHEDRHLAAARMLAERMQWTGTMMGGALPSPHTGYAFVFVD